MPFGVLTTVVCSQSGADFGTRFWKNDEPFADHWLEKRLADG